MINFQPLFTTSRVITAVYRIAVTSVLLMSLARRVREGQRISRTRGRYHD